MKSSIIKYSLITIVLISVSACGNGSEDSQRDFSGMRGGNSAPTSVEVVPVSTSSISAQVRAFGIIQAQDVVDINPQVSNRVTKIHADLGDSVSAGQVLAKIYDVPFQDEYEQAQAQFRQSQSTFQRDSTQFVRQETLYESGSISSVEFEEASANYANSRASREAARAALTQSRENLANTEIKSPVNGVVLNRNIAEGDIASTGETAFEIANLVGYETRLFLPLEDWDAMTVGQDVELRLSNRQEIVARGSVSRISPRLNPTTGLGEVVVSLTEVTPRLRQGALAESRITLETRENTLVIPRAAMIEKVDTYIEPETNTVELRRSYSVFVAQGDTIATQKDITLGLEQGERIEVLGGIEEGNKLIVTGQSSLRDSGRIRIAGQSSEGSREEQIDNLEQTGQNGETRRRPSNN